MAAENRQRNASAGPAHDGHRQLTTSQGLSRPPWPGNRREHAIRSDPRPIRHPPSLEIRIMRSHYIPVPKETLSTLSSLKYAHTFSKNTYPTTDKARMRESVITKHGIIEQDSKSSTSIRSNISPIPLTLILLKTGGLVPEATQKFGTYHDVFCELFKNGLNFNPTCDLSSSSDHHNHNHNHNHEHEDEHEHEHEHDRNLDDQPQSKLKDDLQSDSTNSSNTRAVASLRIISFNVTQSDTEPIEYPSSDILNSSVGIIISGSSSNAYDKVEWIDRLIEFLKDVIDRFDHLKLFGICFGHQVLSRVLGSQVIKNSLGWELGIQPLDLNPLANHLFFHRSAHLDLEPQQTLISQPLKIFQVHQDIVTSSPVSTYNIGSSAKSQTQGWIKLKDTKPNNPSENSIKGTGEDDLSKIDLNELNDRIQILTLQGHPEYHSQLLIEYLNHRTQHGTQFDLIDKISYQVALDSLAKFPNPLDHHGSLVALRILQILHVL